jgi:hypothetical protein
MANKENKSSFQLIVEMTKKLDPTFALNEANEKWIQGALGKTEKKPEGKHPGALHKDLGIPADKKIPMSVINKKIAAIRAKEKDGKKLSAEDRKELKRLVLAKTLKSENVKSTKGKLNEDETKVNDVPMVKSQLEDLAKAAGDIYNRLDGDVLPAWIIEKVAVACENLYDIHNALHTGEESKEGMKGIEDDIEMDTENEEEPIIRGKFQGGE